MFFTISMLLKQKADKKRQLEESARKMAQEAEMKSRTSAADDTKKPTEV